MNKIGKINKELNKLERQYQRSKTLFALNASHQLNKAVLTANCAKNTTFKEAKFTSDMVNFFFKRDTTPYQFMVSVEENANKSIEEYQKFKKSVSICPYDERIINSFSLWYTHSGFESAILKCNIGYIIHFGLAVQKKNLGMITETEMWQSFANIVEVGDSLFTFHPGLVMRTFVKTVKKFGEIERKIEKRMTC